MIRQHSHKLHADIMHEHDDALLRASVTMEYNSIPSKLINRLCHFEQFCDACLSCVAGRVGTRRTFQQHLLHHGRRLLWLRQDPLSM